MNGNLAGPGTGPILPCFDPDSVSRPSCFQTVCDSIYFYFYSWREFILLYKYISDSIDAKEQTFS